MYPCSMLLLGANGQLGHAFLADVRAGMALHPVPANCYPGNNGGDSLHVLINNRAPQVIINAAAYTNVEQAEQEPDRAMAANRDMVANLARLAKQYNILLVHFSTDYVFDGNGEQAWREGSQPAPLNVYGQSKWQGEQAIIASGCRHLILRTSWLHSPWRHNFIKTMLRLGQAQSELSVVCDQVGGPTSASMLADMALLAIGRTLADPSLAELYHVAASGAVSWFDYASFMFDEAHNMGLIDRVPKLIPVTSEHYPTQVRRPLNSRLDTTRFCNAFGVQLPDWQDGVRNTLMQLQEGK